MWRCSRTPARIGLVLLHLEALVLQELEEVWRVSRQDPRRDLEYREIQGLKNSYCLTPPEMQGVLKVEVVLVV